MEKRCIICNKKFISNDKRKKICGDNNCRLRRGRKWHNTNKEKHNKQKRDYYQKHKFIWHNYYQNNKEIHNCRCITNKLLLNNIIQLDRECNSCKSNKHLEFHHEIYPNTKEKIIKAIKEKKIYLLCKKCHDKHRLL